MAKAYSTANNTDKLSIITKCPQKTDDKTLDFLSGFTMPVDEGDIAKENSQISLFAVDSEIEDNSILLSLDDVCKRLSISTATGRNWIKAEKLIPFMYEQKKPLFTMESIQNLLDSINSGELNKLKSRRNKKKVSGVGTYRDYVSDSGHNMQIVERLVVHDSAAYSERNLRIILASFAIQLILQKNNTVYDVDKLLSNFINGGISLGCFRPLICDLIKDTECLENDACALSFAINEKPNFVEGQDFLGLVYISLSNMAQRKTTGAYYTPIAIVEKLIHEIKANININNEDIFDPCCGTGNFLIALKKHNVAVSNLYGQDIDEISCQLLRINIALNYDVEDASILYSHFVTGNTLKMNAYNSFGIILGNPPWGYDFSNEDTKYLLQNYETATEKGLESYDLFVEKSLRLLRRNGMIAFVLPEAILNVKTHKTIRGLLLENCSFKFIDYIGNAFSGVQCPSIILGVSCDGQSSTVGCKIISNEVSFTIHEQRSLNSDCIALNLTDNERKCIEKISSKDTFFTLKDSADFALGIVTGDNKSAISQFQKLNSEIILKGSDVKKYSFNNPHNYIQFIPESFQQVAPVEKYRAPEKLLYRFICESLVFAYDDRQTLSLNSCNILIPHIEGIDMKYILGVLNSRVATFWWKKKFNSIKVLKSHIEEIPFPVPPDHTHQRIVTKINQILALNGEGVSDLYESIDKDIMELYGLSGDEQLIIHQALEKTNMFI